MVNTIIAGSGINQLRAVSKGGNGTFNHFLRDTDWIKPLDLGTINSNQEPSFGSWSNGTGTQIGTGGSMLFTSASGGGSLKTVVISNKGTNILYYGINSDGIAIASGGFPLGTGEAILIDNIFINKLWALSASSTTVINAQGVYNYNPNTI